jgi:hypothetical protein
MPRFALNIDRSLDAPTSQKLLVHYPRIRPAGNELLELLIHTPAELDIGAERDADRLRPEVPLRESFFRQIAQFAFHGRFPSSLGMPLNITFPSIFT